MKKTISINILIILLISAAFLFMFKKEKAYETEYGTFTTKKTPFFCPNRRLNEISVGRINDEEMVLIGQKKYCTYNFVTDKFEKQKFKIRYLKDSYIVEIMPNNIVVFRDLSDVCNIKTGTQQIMSHENFVNFRNTHVQVDNDRILVYNEISYDDFTYDIFNTASMTREAEIQAPIDNYDEMYSFRIDYSKTLIVNQIKEKFQIFDTKKGIPEDIKFDAPKTPSYQFGNFSTLYPHRKGVFCLIRERKDFSTKEYMNELHFYKIKDNKIVLEKIIDIKGMEESADEMKVIAFDKDKFIFYNGRHFDPKHWYEKTNIYIYDAGKNKLITIKDGLPPQGKTGVFLNENKIALFRVDEPRKFLLFEKKHDLLSKKSLVKQ